MQPKENPLATPEKERGVESLTNRELAYLLALQLNHIYDYGGYSIGRSPRSVLLDLFIALNRDTKTDGGDPLKPPYGEQIQIEAEKRCAKNEPSLFTEHGEADIQNPLLVSLLILYKLRNVYKEGVAQIDQAETTTDADLSFEGSPLKLFTTLYTIFLSYLGYTEDELSVLDKKYDIKFLRDYVHQHEVPENM